MYSKEEIEKWKVQIKMAANRTYMGDSYTSTALASSEGVIWFPKSLGYNPHTQVLPWLEKIPEKRNKAVR